MSVSFVVLLPLLLLLTARGTALMRWKKATTANWGHKEPMRLGYTHAQQKKTLGLV